MISAELDTLRTAAERNDRIAVMKAIEHLNEAFERDRLHSRRFDTMATLLDQRIDDANGGAAKGEYREVVLELEQRQIELERSALAYVQGEGSSETLVESVDAADKASHTYQKSTGRLETTVSDIPILPLVVLWGGSALEIPTSMAAHTEVNLSTVGRSHPDSISIDVESEIPVGVSSPLVKGLDENETIAIRIDLSPSVAGEFDVFITATGEANVDRFRFTVLVFTKREYVVRASRLASSLETMLDSTGGRRNGSRNQVRTLRRRLESIADDLEKRRRPANSIDNGLNAVYNNIEALKRQTSTFSPSVRRQETIYLLEDISRAVNSAIKALS